MVIKVYISGMSGSKEVKKRQQRVTMILDSKHITYNVIDITEPGQEAEKDFMQKNSEHSGATISDQTPRHPLPPQLFNETEYCGDYDDFDLANEVDNLEVFLKLEAPKPAVNSTSEEVSVDQQQTNGTGDAQDQSQVTATEAAADDDEDKENKTEGGANEALVEHMKTNGELQRTDNEATNDEDVKTIGTRDDKDECSKLEECEGSKEIEKTSKESPEDTSGCIKSEKSEQTDKNAVDVVSEDAESEMSSKTKNESSEHTNEEIDTNEEVSANNREEVHEVIHPHETSPSIEVSAETQKSVPIDEQDENDTEQKPIERIDTDEEKNVAETEVTNDTEADTVVDVKEVDDTKNHSTEDLQSAKDPPGTVLGEQDHTESDGNEHDIESEKSYSEEIDSVKEVTTPEDSRQTDEPQVDRLPYDTNGTKTNFSEKPTTEVDEDVEQEELLKVVAAMGKREDEEDRQPETEDVELGEEEEISDKLADTDEPMLATEESEE
ncbi:RNA polymerase-associated protein LEO1 [Malaya genurostris]|uniref:RNA polymerase-associated protein LEO1 n=1 Tax=Malaya genurostris TaxID=325434 RepID=UPI0026F3A3A3|nr:RNA polymerase-associated protein LEO1 [Malaya genurostris]